MPLFPLNTVLFPYASIQLHVFEERYREMVRLCLHEDRPFGVVLIRSGPEVGGRAEPYLVGTACRIQRVHTYDDGRLDVHVVGERRFRIREIDDSRPFFMGQVEPVIEHEIEDVGRAEELLSRARTEFEMLIRRQIERQEISVKVVFPSDPVVLSFTIANLLQMANLEKQRLLETTDTLERVEDLIPVLERHILEAEISDAAPSATYYRLGADDLREWITPN
ncbi:peptidase S16 lon domain-containing protein [Fimbriimonas ginsengisoli Gsoil 348]|uniref:Peptidase S16 lon domain-containing protein n=2 Tax=Fimbriimonas ginsengisoli TaxID=1005039 RepID=A0A068NSC4_FIMGI|nr:peptidase S16 lon domain-containing protein [Fimbriimonas ginsengisoli Gsoil 348]